MNYANTTTYKTILARIGNAEANTAAQVGLWSSTAAINSISMTASDTGQGGNTDYFTAGSTFTLYGVLNA